MAAFTHEAFRQARWDRDMVRLRQRIEDWMKDEYNAVYVKDFTTIGTKETADMIHGIVMEFNSGSGGQTLLVKFVDSRPIVFAYTEEAKLTSTP